MASNINQIPNKEVHDRIVDESESTPTIIYVSNNAMPVCRDFTPQYENLADKYSNEQSKQSVRFCQLEITSETSSMFKFSPNQLPVVVLMCRGPWSKTLMSPKIAQLEDQVKLLVEKAGALPN